MTPIPRNQARFTLAEVAEITSGRVRGNPDRVCVGVQTDSRQVLSNELFVPLAGENHDAHAFLASVAGTGAAAVVRHGRDAAGMDCVEVSDTALALRQLAARHRQRWAGTVVGITGSAGKTSTKELTAAALRGCGRRVRATVGNLNNLVGVPMTLFTIEDTDQVAVVEMGTSEPGEIETLAAIAGADVGVVTLVAIAHTEGLGTLADVAVEKRALLRSLSPEGWAIVNADDAELATWSSENTITFGTSASDVRLGDWSLRGTQTHARYEVRDHGAVDVETQLVGEAAALNAAAALAVVRALGLDLGAAARGMATVEPVAGRMRPIDVDGVLILDDTYNANPTSMAMAIRTAKRIAETRSGRLVAVLGDMGELGAESPGAHRAVRALADAACDTVAYVGGEMAAHGAAVGHARDVRVPALSRNDVLLVKGSRSMHLETVVEAVSTAASASGGAA